MPAKSPSQSANRLLAALSSADLRLLQPHLRHVPLRLFQDLEQPNRPIEQVYFPHFGIASVVAVQSKDTRVEVGLIGYEGMTGTAIVLGSDRLPHETYVQVAGEGERISARTLRETMKESQSLRMSLLKYVQAFMVQTAHTAISNARGRLDARLARWILMAHDRVRDETLPLTHQFLALMLGVRRAGVTTTAQELQRSGLISYRQREVTILDTDGLEALACECYRLDQAQLNHSQM